MFHKPKPETIARHARERAASREASHANLVARLQAKVKEYGQDSIWSEMLADAVARKSPVDTD